MARPASEPLPFPQIPQTGETLPPADRAFLLRLQQQALQYFRERQVSQGLILDRQRNHGSPHTEGLCSLAATGMGFLALALAAAPPYRLLTPALAAQRIGTGLRTVLDHLPHDQGVVPHFVDSTTGVV